MTPPRKKMLVIPYIRLPQSEALVLENIFCVDSRWEGLFVIISIVRVHAEGCSAVNVAVPTEKLT